MGADPRIPVVLCVDVEPDPRLVDRRAPEPWLGYELAQQWCEELRARLSERSGEPARLCWFLRMDEQIRDAYGSATFVPDRYGDHLEAVRAAGDEVGIHPHPYRWDEANGCWLQDFGSPSATMDSLSSSIEAYEEAFGAAPRSLRFGDAWLSTAIVDQAEALGIRHELTLEPGLRGKRLPNPVEQVTGRRPDYRQVPRRPYAPSRADFRLAAPDDSRTIRMLPLTSGVVPVGRTSFRRRRVPLSLWQTWEPPTPFGRMLDQVVAESHRPYLAFAIRTGDLTAQPWARKAMERSLDALVGHAAAPRFSLCTPDEAVAALG